MAIFKIKTKNKIDIEKKPRVYFTCHPDDFEKHFNKICDDIFKTHDCAIYYTEDMNDKIPDDEKVMDLGRNNLLVVPVTLKLLTSSNRAMDEDIPYALEMHMPILPIVMEPGLDEFYSKLDKFGELQYLNAYSFDLTEIPYEQKLKKHLDLVLNSNEVFNRIREAFANHLFLSYRKKDRKYANELISIIHSNPECRDIAIWFDEFLNPGESFSENIKINLNRYLKYIDLVKDGKTQLNAKTLYPYEIIRDAIKPGLLKNDIDVLDATWKNLPNFCDGRNAIAVIDGSGSMVGTPLNIATSLGIYFAERNRGYFHNHFITFSKNPKLVKIHGNTIVDKAEYCMSYNEIANTDLIKVFGLILKVAIENNLPQSELPETIYVISDMEFDAGVCDNISLHEEVKELFEKHGYILPNIVYWNVDSRNNQYPVKANEYGCVLVSGASPSVFKMVISQEISPLKFMLSVLDSERYSKICA